MLNWLGNFGNIALEYLEKNGVDSLDTLISETEQKNKGKPKKTKP